MDDGTYGKVLAKYGEGIVASDTAVINLGQ